MDFGSIWYQNSMFFFQKLKKNSTADIMEINPKSMQIAGHFPKFQIDRSPSSDGARIFPDQHWKGQNFLARLVLFLERFRRIPRPR